MDIKAKSCRAVWKIACDLSYRQHTVLALLKPHFPVTTCKILRVSVRATQLALTRARVKVSLSARCARLVGVLWGFSKLCCDSDGKRSEQSVF